MRRSRMIPLALILAALAVFVLEIRSDSKRDVKLNGFDKVIVNNSADLLADGRQTFRFDTFGDEAFWGDTLQLHKAIEGAKFGGVGDGVSPATALAVGLKVDVDALPQPLINQLKQGKVDLNDPATTLALLKLNAVVGVTGDFNADGSLKGMGIQCALCHSTVDNSFAPGIGHRLDGWANRDLDVGTIVNLAPDDGLEHVADLLGVPLATVRAVLKSWGPGKFDAELFMDGKAVNPQQVTDGQPTGPGVPSLNLAAPAASAATLIPPAFGLAGVNLHTWTGWGSVPYWNAFVANLEMHGIGNFYDPRLDNAAQFPVAAANGFGHVRHDTDLITPKLPALHAYQIDIPAPTPPANSFDKDKAAAGRALFNGKAQCSTCHVQDNQTDPGWNLHTANEICVDGFQADRAPDHRYRTAPLNGLWTHTKGGFYHDGRFATLDKVVDHYNACMKLGLSADEQSDVVEYLKSLPSTGQ